MEELSELEQRVLIAIPEDGTRVSPATLAQTLGLAKDDVVRALMRLHLEYRVDVVVWFEEHDPPMEVWRRPRGAVYLRRRGLDDRS